MHIWNDTETSLSFARSQNMPAFFSFLWFLCMNMNGDFSRRADALDVGQNLAASAAAKKVWNLRSWWSGLSQVFGCLVILLTRSAKKRCYFGVASATHVSGHYLCGFDCGFSFQLRLHSKRAADVLTRGEPTGLVSPYWIRSSSCSILPHRVLQTCKHIRCRWSEKDGKKKNRRKTTIYSMIFYG